MTKKNKNPRSTFDILCRTSQGSAFSIGGILTLVVAATVMTPEAQAERKAFTETLPQAAVKLEMVPIPGGQVKIGDKDVTVKPLYMSKTEIPWEVFDAYINSGPPSKSYDMTPFAPDAIARPSKSYVLPDQGWGHNGYPVISISYTSAEMFVRWLSAATKKKYRLPTEAEWELAARGGVKGEWKMEPAEIEKIAWHEGNALETTHPVGKKAPNAFGLHDMVGNVGEWAYDLEGKPILMGSTFRDPLDLQGPLRKQKYHRDWQQSDPQMPKSRWWFTDGPFCGLRVVTEG